MDNPKENPKGSTVPNDLIPQQKAPKDVATNPALNIKRIRTFAEDLEEAKKQAENKPVEVKKAKKSWFGGKKEEPEPKEKPIKTLTPSTIEGMPTPKKKGGFSVSKLTKELEQTNAPKEKAKVPKDERERIEMEAKAIMAGKKVEEEPIPTPPTPPTPPESIPSTDKQQPSKKRIEEELRKSGIIPDEAIKDTKKEPITPRIRTLKNDAAESIRDKKMSVLSIASAAEKKRTTEHGYGEITQETGLTSKKIGIILISVSLVVVGVLSSWYAYSKSESYNGIKIHEKSISFITSDRQIELNTNNSQGKVLLNSMNDKREQDSNPTGTITHHILVSADTSIKTETFLNRVNSNIPSQFTRSLEDEFMYGVYSSEENVPFIIFKTNNFSNTFAGMLQWETTIVSDLAPLFGTEYIGEESITLARDFTDEIIKNQDTRILRHSNGDVSLMYAFPNKNTLIITNNTEAFYEVFKRLNTSQTGSN